MNIKEEKKVKCNN